MGLTAMTSTNVMMLTEAALSFVSTVQANTNVRVETDFFWTQINARAQTSMSASNKTVAALKSAATAMGASNASVVMATT